MWFAPKKLKQIFSKKVWNHEIEKKVEKFLDFQEIFEGMLSNLNKKTFEKSLES